VRLVHKGRLKEELPHELYLIHGQYKSDNLRPRG
jgi:hypothetical protein